MDPALDPDEVHFEFEVNKAIRIRSNAIFYLFIFIVGCKSVWGRYASVFFGVGHPQSDPPRRLG